MRYFFDGKIEKQDDVYCIRIPFNVWEVCKLRDIIKAELVLDNRIIDCELLPETKGNYKIHLSDEDVSHTNIDQVHKILLHITGSLIQMYIYSPYSLDNPIWKIEGIEIIILTDNNFCGQPFLDNLPFVTLS